MADKNEVESIFAAVVQCSGADLEALLDQKCGSDSKLRQEVESLLAANQAMGSFLEQTQDHRSEPQPNSVAKSDSASSVHGRFLPGTMIQQRYRIVSLVGRGGMGEVYRADDLKLGQTVALKFLPPEFSANEKRLEYFHREVSLTRQITHSNVCRVYDIGEFDGQHFLSMEYIDGEDLHVLLRRIGRLPADKGIEIAQQLCAGLAAAHENGVLHRDLKPANIMIDGQGRARITDFGLATISTEAGTGEIAGTPAYMAPEQLLRGQTSEQSDLYSLGLVLAELFMGQPVNKANNINELRDSHRSAESASSTEISIVDVDPIVQQAILKCLQKAPENRPVSARQLANALPGGDLLDAALAAGTTPLPEMILNSQEKAQLSLTQGAAVLAFVLCGVIGSGLMQRKFVKYYEAPPAIHSAQCEQMMNELGYSNLPSDSLFNVSSHVSMARDLAIGTRTQEWFEQHRQPPYQFWKKWTNGSFAVEDVHFPTQFTFDRKAVDATFTAGIMLDEKGKLLRLQVGGSEMQQLNANKADINWDHVLELAGVDPESIQPITPPATPPVYCDQVVAWSGLDGSDLELQAGAVGGRINYFETLGLAEQLKHPKPPEIPYVSSILVSNLFVWAFALINLVYGKADWRGALRAGALVFLLYGLIELLAIRIHSNTLLLDGLGIIHDRGWGHIVGHAVTMVGTYLAIEPFFRRYWPRKLVGLARVLQGRFKDPLVGQELLLGVAAGSAVLLMTGFLTPALYKASAPTFLTPEFSHEHQGAYWIAQNLQDISTAFLLIFMISALVVLLRCLTGKRGFGFAVLLPTVLLAFSLSGVVTWYFPVAAITVIGCMVVFALTRLGFLTAWVFLSMLVVMLPNFVPPNPGSWYAVYGFCSIAIPIAIASYGFLASQGGLIAIIRKLEANSD